MKAYLDHTQVVLNGDAALNIGQLLHPFNVLSNHAQMAQAALMQQGGAASFTNGQTLKESAEPDGKKKRKKRAYKPRDPNAPKRPLTAYFRYLGEMRPLIQAELQHNPELFADKGKPGDISRVATDRWNALSKEEQEPYRQAYRSALKTYEEQVAAYKAEGGQVEDATLTDVDADAEVDVGVDVDAGAPAEKKKEEEEAEADADTSSADSSESDEDDEEEEVAAPPPPPPPAQETKKTPKSAMKKGKQFSSINPEPTPVAPAKSSSPERKRKAAAEEEEAPKKKRGRKSNAVVAGADTSSPPARAPAPVAPMAASSLEAVPAGEAVNKKKKDKKRKSKGGDA